MNPFLLSDFILFLALVAGIIAVMGFVINLKHVARLPIMLGLSVLVLVFLVTNISAVYGPHLNEIENRINITNATYLGFSFKGVPVYSLNMSIAGLYEKNNYTIYLSEKFLKDGSFKSLILAHEYCHYMQDIENRTMSENECYHSQDNIFTWLD